MNDESKRSTVQGFEKGSRRRFLSNAKKGVVMAAVALGVVGAKGSDAAAGCYCWGPWQYYSCEIINCGTGGVKYSGRTILRASKRYRGSDGVCRSHCEWGYRYAYTSYCSASQCMP